MSTINLKNYTSSVAVNESIKNIEHKLGQAGAVLINKTLKDGKVTGIIFTIMRNGLPLNFKLPANPENVLKYMINQRSKPPSKPQLEALTQQAERTAWRSLYELTSIEVDYALQEQTDLANLMMGRLIDKEGKTLFERASSDNFTKLLK